MTNTIDFIAYVRVEPELLEEAKACILRSAIASRTEPGCLHFDVHMTKNKPHYFVIYQSWSNEADLDRHQLTAHTLQIKEDFKRLQALVDLQPIEQL